jgi:hypothetical protein
MRVGCVQPGNHGLGASVPYPLKYYSMITIVMLIVSGIIFIIATAVFLAVVIRAPLAIEDENGFRYLEETDLVRPRRFDSVDGTIYAAPVPYAPSFRDLARPPGRAEDSHPAYIGAYRWDLRKEEKAETAPTALGVPVTDDAGLMTGA